MAVKKTVFSQLLDAGIELTEWVKGIAAFLVAVFGIYVVLMPTHPSEGDSFWVCIVTGSVIFFLGASRFWTFIKLFQAGELTRDTAAVVSKFGSSERTKGFLAFLSIGAGIIFILNAHHWSLRDAIPEWLSYLLGLIFFAAGITFIWTRSRFYKN
ncbi:MAG: hypothetical protein KGL64_07885 [Acidobacteriota bacterium]|nr:hypothetical protein [Acidobacteriota bacterium]